MGVFSKDGDLCPEQGIFHGDTDHCETAANVASRAVQRSKDLLPRLSIHLRNAEQAWNGVAPDSGTMAVLKGCVGAALKVLMREHHISSSTLGDLESTL